MSTQASSAVTKEQWLAFADRLIALAYAIFGEAKIEITERLFGEPKILSLALLCRTVGNFKGVVALTKEGLVVEARTLTRSCYENLYCMAALIEQGNDFVKALHQDLMRSLRSQGEFLLDGFDSEHIGDAEFVELRARVKEIKSRWPKANFVTPKQVVKDSVLKQSYLLYSKLSGDAAHPSVLALKRHLVRFVENGEQVVGLDVNPPERGNELADGVWEPTSLSAVPIRPGRLSTTCAGMQVAQRDRLGSMNFVTTPPGASWASANRRSSSKWNSARFAMSLGAKGIHRQIKRLG
jgi:hypothetical protein